MMLVLAGVLVAVVLMARWGKRAQLTSSKRGPIFLLVVITGIVLLFVMVHFLSRPPKEVKFIAHFYAHRDSYEQLRKMLIEDDDLKDVATWGIQRTDSPTWTLPPDGDISGKRFQEYLVLLKEIDAVRAFHSKSNSEVRISVWGSGFAGIHGMLLSHGWITNRRI